jgi:hypothetical protein
LRVAGLASLFAATYGSGFAAFNLFLATCSATSFLGSGLA